MNVGITLPAVGIQNPSILVLEIALRTEFAFQTKVRVGTYLPNEFG